MPGQAMPGLSGRQPVRCGYRLRRAGRAAAAVDGRILARHGHAVRSSFLPHPCGKRGAICARLDVTHATGTMPLD